MHADWSLEHCRSYPTTLLEDVFFWQHIRPMQGFDFNVSSLTDVNLLAIWLGGTVLVAMTMGWLPYVKGFRQAPPQRPPAAMPNVFEGQRQTSGTSEGTAVRDLQFGLVSSQTPMRGKWTHHQIIKSLGYGQYPHRGCAWKRRTPPIMAFESVWAKGSSNSEGLSNIFTSSHNIFKSSHLLILTSSHPHIFTSSSSHLLISSSHLHIFSSSHLHIFTSSHLLIFSSSHLHTFSSSHLLIFSSSHLLIFSSSHLHIFSSSHLLIFSSSHLLIFTSAHLLTFLSSHLHIFSSSRLHIFISSHSLLPSCSLALWLSCPLALSFFSISLLKARGSANETARNATLSHETRFDRQKLRLNCDFSGPIATLSHEMRFDRQKLNVKASVCKSLCV